MVVNEIQRSINGGFGNAQRFQPPVIPYGHFRAYSPRDAARAGGILGDIPNDFEASVDLQYIPVRQGWYYGYPVNGSGYPKLPQGMLGDSAIAVTPAAAAPTSDPTELAKVAKWEKVQTMLQFFSTAAVVTMAGLAVFKVLGEARQGRSRSR